MVIVFGLYPDNIFNNSPIFQPCEADNVLICILRLSLNILPSLKGCVVN